MYSLQDLRNTPGNIWEIHHLRNTLLQSEKYSLHHHNHLLIGCGQQRPKRAWGHETASLAFTNITIGWFFTISRFSQKCGKVTSKKWGAGLVIKLASFRDGSDPDGLKDICKLSRRWDSFADSPVSESLTRLPPTEIDLSSQKTNKIQKPKLTSHLKKQNQNLTLISKNKTKIDLSSQKNKKTKLTSHLKKNWTKIDLSYQTLKLRHCHPCLEKIMLFLTFWNFQKCQEKLYFTSHDSFKNVYMVKRTYLLVNSFEWQLLKPERHGRLQTQGHHQSRYVPAANPGSHTYVYVHCKNHHNIPAYIQIPPCPCPWVGDC